MTRSIKSLIVVLFFAFCFILCQPAYGLSPILRQNITKEAEIVSVRGDSWVRFLKEKAWIDAVREQFLTSGDALKTGNFGKMSILFADDLQINMHSKTTLVIKEVRGSREAKRSVLGLEAGEIWSRAKTVPQGLMIETPSATAAIRGTDLDVVVDEKGTCYLAVFRGLVELYNDFGRVMVGTGEQAVAEIGKPPVKTMIVRPKERTQWLVSYRMDIVKFIPFYSYRRQEVLKLLPSVKEAVEKDPKDLGSKLMLAGLLFDLREKEESLRLFNEILQSEPTNSRALTFRGLLALDKGETDNAASFFTQALKSCKKGEDVEPLMGMFGVYLQKNEMEKASKLLDQVMQKTPVPLAAFMTAVFNAYQGKFTEAIAICEDYARKFPEQEIFPVLIAHFYLSIDEAGKAKEWIDKAAAINPQSGHVYAFLGEYYYIEGKGLEAEDSLRKSLELDPKNDIALDVLGLVMLDKGNYEESIRIFSEALELYPRDPLFWSNRGLALAWVEDTKKARTDYSVSAELDPGNPETFKGLGLLELMEGRTDEALKYLLKSSLMEPSYASPHIYLAVGYYQRGEVARALDELKLAEQLDPRDPLPHIVAQIIYQDIYRPFDAVQEATKALELMPFMKSVVPIENTKTALADLGAALLNFDLSEWAGSYSEESFDPHNASSHFFRALQYANNPTVSASELITGILLDPLSISSPTRYSDIIRRPRHDATIHAQIGSEDGGFSQSYNGTFQGYFRKPWDISYYVSLTKFHNDGFRENGYSEGDSVFYGIGMQPNYKNGFFAYGWTSESKSGEPGPVTAPDPDDRNEQRSNQISLGYYHRFGYRNDLLARFAYQKMDSEFINPDPFGTGMSDIVLSFIQAFGLDTARYFFNKGVYDITQIVGASRPTLATDSTGMLAQEFGLSPIQGNIPGIVDFNPIHLFKTTDEALAFQTRHLFDIAGGHQISYGIEYLPDRISTSFRFNMLNDSGFIDFCDEANSESIQCSYFTHYNASLDSASVQDTLRFLVAYVHDRWRVSENVLIEGGIFYESLDKKEDYQGIHPRIGVAFQVGKHILRLGFQKWLQPATIGTIAPVSSAGLIVDSRLASVGARLTDYQARLESRWSSRFFTSVSAERVELRDTAEPLAVLTRGATNSLSLAVNSIVTDNASLFLRYIYTDSENKEDAYKDNRIPQIPDHTIQAGVLCVLPKYIRAGLIATYTGRQYSDYNNEYILSDHITADFSLVWEPFKKHTLFSLAINNIFDKHFETYHGYPAAGRSVYFTAEYRF